jgi:hypothetical protein
MTKSLREREVAFYQDAVRAYRQAAENLADKHGDEFMRAFEETDRLRKVAEEFRPRIDISNPNN